jgi:hypothetical protein
MINNEKIRWGDKMKRRFAWFLAIGLFVVAAICVLFVPFTHNTVLFCDVSAEGILISCAVVTMLASMIAKYYADGWSLKIAYKFIWRAILICLIMLATLGAATLIIKNLYRT